MIFCQNQRFHFKLNISLMSCLKAPQGTAFEDECEYYPLKHLNIDTNNEFIINNINL